MSGGSARGPKRRQRARTRRLSPLVAALLACGAPALASAAVVVDLLPDLITRENDLYDNDVVIDIIELGRTHLRLSNGTANVGSGQLYLYGVEPAHPDGTQDVRQRVWRSDGSTYDLPAGRFVFHPLHDHIHVEDWSIYRLREALPGGGVGAIVASGQKTSFCILDVAVFDSSLPGWSRFPEFDSCGGSSQGLSIGWIDIYTKDLPGQHIDVTGLPDGIYWLESEVDPQNHILEANEANNVARVQIVLGDVGPTTPDAYEPNATTAAVAQRPPGGPNSPNLGPCGPVRTVAPLSIHQSGDDDYFRFYLNHTGSASDFVRITFDHSLGNLDLRLLNAAGVQVRSSNGQGNVEQISLSAMAEGWYYPRVVGAQGAVNAYYSLTVDPAQNASPQVVVTSPPAGDVRVEHGLENYIVNWAATDPESDPTWVTVIVNSQPLFDGNEFLLPTSLHLDGALGFAVLNTAELELGTYWVYCRVTDGGTVTGSWSAGTVTLVEETIDADSVPDRPADALRLLPASPSPFNARTTLVLHLAEPAVLDWAIYDARGRRVRTVVEGWTPAGRLVAGWDGTDDTGWPVASGVYLQRAIAAGTARQSKLTLAK